MIYNHIQRVGNPDDEGRSGFRELAETLFAPRLGFAIVSSLFRINSFI